MTYDVEREFFFLSRLIEINMVSEIDWLHVPPGKASTLLMTVHLITG